MIEVTPEMRLAMRLLRAAGGGVGADFYPTHEHELPCGCRGLSGWDVVKEEPAGAFIVCSAAHQEAAKRAWERFGEPESAARFDDVDAHVAIGTLLAEEIERGHA